MRSLLERFRLKATVFEESKDLNAIKIAELGGSLQTNELSIPYFKKNKSLALNTLEETCD